MKFRRQSAAFLKSGTLWAVSTIIPRVMPTFYAGDSGAAGVTSCHRQNQHHQMNETPISEVRIARARVTHISVSRLYGLGNYQNVRYELGAEVPAEACAAGVFKELFYILQMLKPLPVPSCKRDYERAIKKTEQELSNYERENLESWRETVEHYDTRRRLRLEAVKALDTLGGHSEFRDAKDSWDDPNDNDDPVF